MPKDCRIREKSNEWQKHFKTVSKWLGIWKAPFTLLYPFNSWNAAFINERIALWSVKDLLWAHTVHIPERFRDQRFTGRRSGSHICDIVIDGTGVNLHELQKANT